MYSKCVMEQHVETKLQACQKWENIHLSEDYYEMSQQLILVLIIKDSYYNLLIKLNQVSYEESKVIYLCKINCIDVEQNI